MTPWYRGLRADTNTVGAGEAFRGQREDVGKRERHLDRFGENPIKLNDQLSSRGVERPTMAPESDTRERLVAAAAELFHRNGYAATGVAQILRAANANSGSLYYFFPTKEDLLLAVLERYKGMLWPVVIQPVYDRVSDPIERIFGVLDGYRQMLRLTKCTHGCPIGNLALELSDSHPAVRKLIAENFTGWRQAVRQAVEDAADRLPDDIDSDMLASFVLTVMEGGVMQARAYKSLEPFETAVAMLRDYFDRLLADGTTWSQPRSAAPEARNSRGGGRRPPGRR